MGVIAGAALVGAAAGTSGALLTGGPESTSDDTALFHGASRLPSTTPQDWVTYADYVLVLRPTAEQPTSLSGDDDALVMRDVASDVVRVAWRSPSATQSAPSQLNMVMVGTHTTSDGEQIDVAMEGAPRLEVGHTYLAAVSYVPARCSAGDIPEPAHFELLGEDALVPFDKGVVGQGEMEGTVRTASAASAAQGEQALVSVLRGTSPARRQTFSAPAPCS